MPSPAPARGITASTDLSMANSSSFFCCPRHFHQACEICVDPGLCAHQARAEEAVRTSARPLRRVTTPRPFAEVAGAVGTLARQGCGLAAGTLLRRGNSPVDETRVVDASARTDTDQRHAAQRHAARGTYPAVCAAFCTHRVRGRGREVGVEEMVAAGGPRVDS
ncbi:hypothetical protein BJV78DRAFT_698922 [Lactifluus subvellereus]|nr:hypothetical protein BJV78DRAFT_698922 [Lactifluus subvellereus]